MLAVFQARGADVSSTAKVIQCPCGYVLHGDDDDAVVRAAQTHADDVHGQQLSHEQALSMARPA
jgi:predicted small metal-binding protein